MNHKILILLASLTLAACGAGEQQQSTLNDASSKESCEVTQDFTVRSGTVSADFQLQGKGEVLRVNQVLAKANCYQGGYGWYIGNWNINYDVAVKNLAFEKRFVIQDAAGLADRRVLNANEVTYLSSDADGYDRFQFTRMVYSVEAVRLSVIVGATYNATPNIGNPVAGWTGPAYGFIVEP